MEENEDNPNPPANPPKDEPTNPPADPPKNEPEWRGPLQALSDQVTALTEQVKALAPPVTEPPADIIPDEDPVSPPWTHKKLFG